MSNPSTYSKIFFAISLLLVLYLFYRLLEPFLVAIVLAITIVTLFYPAYTGLHTILGRSRGLSAMLMCTIVTLLVILPLGVLLLALFDELNNAYTGFSDLLARDEFSLSETSLLRDVWEQVARSLDIEGMDLTTALSRLIDQVLGYLLQHYSSILGGLGSVVLNFVIVIFSMFFFFRDGERFLTEVKTLIPLNPAYEDMLLAKLKRVIDATFFGILLTAAIQGFAAAGIFWLLGVANPVLWGSATAFFAVVPIVGTAAIWVPISVYLILVGSIGKGILLLVLGATVIGLVDNIIRPLAIEEKAGGMHLLLVFFSLLGGLLLFGPAGLILGPLTASIMVTFIDIYKIEFADQLNPGRE